MSHRRLRTIFGHLKYHQKFKNDPSTSTNTNKYMSTNASKYQYTIDNIRLIDEQRQHYEDNGFLVVPNLVHHELLEKYRTRFLDIIEGRVEYHNITKMKDISLKNRSDVPQERIVNKIQDFIWDDVLSEYCLLPEILNYIECFTGPNIMAMHSMLVNKPPDVGTKSSRHPLHQDLYYFTFRPADRIVCAWTAMEKVDVNNGCLFVVPGSHKGELEKHEYPDWEKGVNILYHGVRGFDDHPKTMLEMEKGDTVFFHPVLLHGSGENRTDRFRKAISCHYAASDCYYIDVKGTVQETIANEVFELARKRGFDMELKDFWKMRSRLMRGREVNM